MQNCLVWQSNIFCPKDFSETSYYCCHQSSYNGNYWKLINAAANRGKQVRPNIFQFFFLLLPPHSHHIFLPLSNLKVVLPVKNKLYFSSGIGYLFRPIDAIYLVVVLPKEEENWCFPHTWHWCYLPIQRRVLCCALEKKKQRCKEEWYGGDIGHIVVETLFYIVRWCH